MNDRVPVSGVDAAGLLSLVVREGLGPAGGLGPSLVRGSGPANPLAEAVTPAALAARLPEASGPARLALSAGLLQILDAWEASHEAAQEADDRGDRDSAAYWHLIAHRREPDAVNARYWSRRVGRHPIHAGLRAIVQDILGPSDIGWLADRGRWDAERFIAACDEAGGRGSDRMDALRRVQRAEMIALLATSVRAAGVAWEGVDQG